MPAPWFGEFIRMLGAVTVLVLGMRMLLGAPQTAAVHCHVPTPAGTASWPVNARLLLQGSAWALIPCGLLYSVLLMSALSASPALGALLAMAFGLGGSPALALIGWSGSRTTTLRNKRRWAGASLMALGTASLIAILISTHGSLPAWCAMNP
jgi:sulfite exporter TauE/SafE